MVLNYKTGVRLASKIGGKGVGLVESGRWTLKNVGRWEVGPKLNRWEMGGREPCHTLLIFTDIYFEKCKSDQ